MYIIIVMHKCELKLSLIFMNCNMYVVQIINVTDSASWGDFIEIHGLNKTGSAWPRRVNPSEVWSQNDNEINLAGGIKLSLSPKGKYIYIAPWWPRGQLSIDFIYISHTIIIKTTWKWKFHSKILKLSGPLFR